MPSLDDARRVFHSNWCDGSEREKVSYLFDAIGEAESVRLLDSEAANGPELHTLSLSEDLGGVHLVLGLSSHHRGYDGDVTRDTKTQCRGDVMSIPGYTELGEVVTLEIGFHKGQTLLTLFKWGKSNDAAHTELRKLLEELETR